MHTTFIPTLLYISLLILSSLAKATIDFLCLVFGVGMAVKSPLGFAARALGLLAVVLAAIRELVVALN